MRSLSGVETRIETTPAGPAGGGVPFMGESKLRLNGFFVSRKAQIHDFPRPAVNSALCSISGEKEVTHPLYQLRENQPMLNRLTMPAVALAAASAMISGTTAAADNNTLDTMVPILELPPPGS